MNGDLGRADAVIRNVKVFNTYFRRFDQADVYLKDGKFLYIDKKFQNEITAEEEIDGQGHYMIPGLIDTHMHIESSLVTPEAFCRFTVRNGLTTIVSEPHEIANVCGIAGVRAMIRDGKKTPYDCYIAIPSNVPVMGREFETSGGTITCEDMLELKKEDGIICLGEVMNFREIIKENDSEVARFIAAVHEQDPNFPLEGHCPALVDSDLAKFLYLGIASDHCGHDVEELRQRFENGMFIQLQDNMVREDTISYVMENNLYEYFAFVTDDTFPDIMCRRGHLDAVMRKAISLGMRVEDAVYCTTYTPSRRMNLLDRGVIAPGKLADFVLLDELESLHIVNTYKRGKCVYDIHDEEDEREDYSLGEEFENTVISRLLTVEDFKVRVTGKNRTVSVRVMGVSADNNTCEEQFVDMEVKDGLLQWQKTDCRLTAVIERHGRDNNIALGFAQGSVIKEGAIASSYAHDSHDLIVMGASEQDMVTAVNWIISKKGGMCAVKDGEIIGSMELPIAGLLSKKSVSKAGAEFDSVRKGYDALGYRHFNNVMNFCLLPLTCIPVLRITDRGYMNTVSLEMVSLYEEKE